MIVTLNEMERTCQKALRGAGAPPGIDDEGGAAAAWLEARGIPALGGLLAAMAAWDGDPSACHPERSSARAFDAGGRSAVFAGPGLAGLAAIAEAPYLEIAGLTEPRFLIPLAKTLCKDERSFFISWRHAGARIGADSGVALLGDWSAPPPGARRVRIGTECPDEELPLTCGAAEVEARYRDSLSRGLPVDENLWRKLAAYAHRTLVPASAASRAQGAGSQSSDNE